MSTNLNPELIQPIEVKIQQTVTTNIRRSVGLSGRQEFFNHKERKEIILNAQVVFPTNKQDTNFSSMGADDETLGYLLLLTEELKAKGVILKRGDLITHFKDQEVQFYISHNVGKLAGQMSDLGLGLVRVFFKDRNPVN